jgi:hypothetical protein
MAIKVLKEIKVLEELIATQLKHLVKKIDTESYYPSEFLKAVGKSGFLHTEGYQENEILFREISLIEEIAKTCMTTAFNLWCHLASLTFVRKSDNPFIKNNLLPLLENGERLGGTGLSNAMKNATGLESLHLKAKRASGGYIFSGQLAAVSNLGLDHFFGIIAEVDDHQRIMALVSCRAEGLKLKKKMDYLAINGSATYTCIFDNVFIADKWIISQRADEFVQMIRPTFLLYQIPLGLGVTDASIRSMQKVYNKQGGCNQYLKIQPNQLLDELNLLRDKTYRLVVSSGSKKYWEDILRVRLDIVYLSLKAAHACMLHQGGSGYLLNSSTSRRLRESYFLVNLTPTVKHLEKIIQALDSNCQ